MGIELRRYRRGSGPPTVHGPPPRLAIAILRIQIYYTIFSHAYAISWPEFGRQAGVPTPFFIPAPSFKTKSTSIMIYNNMFTCTFIFFFSKHALEYNITEKKEVLPPSLWMRRYEREKDSCYTYLTFIINWSVLLWRKVFLGRTFLWMGIASATYWCTRERRSPWPLMIKSDLIINGCSHVYPHQKDASFFMTRHMWHMACAGYKATN